MSKKILFMIDEQFPYGKGEPFLETESNYYSKFDKVIILSNYIGKDRMSRDVSENIIVIRPMNKLFRENDKKLKFLYGFLSLLDFNFYKELYLLKKLKKLNLKTLIHLLSYISKSNISYLFAKKWIENNLEDTDNVIFYSYWLYFQSYIAVKLNKNFKGKSVAISRGHGFDIYEERHNNSYIPLRMHTLKSLDEIYTVSSNGRNHLIDKYKEISSKIHISYLGTLEKGIQNHKNRKHENFSIVSCSRLVSLKRVELIIDAITKIKSDKEIHWDHYGGGDLQDKLESYAKEKLGDKKNVSYTLHGNLANEDIMKAYQNNYYDIFINVSETEGLPVSIMEAMSFGIPVIATNVGGTNEIVDNTINGFLISKDFRIYDLEKKIIEVMEMNYKDKNLLRKMARSKWEENFNADKNYKAFFDLFIKKNEELLERVSK